MQGSVARGNIACAAMCMVGCCRRRPLSLLWRVFLSFLWGGTCGRQTGQRARAASRSSGQDGEEQSEGRELIETFTHCGLHPNRARFLCRRSDRRPVHFATSRHP
jgi:hypothetical protein